MDWAALMAMPVTRFLDVVRLIPAPGLLKPLPEPPPVPMRPVYDTTRLVNGLWPLKGWEPSPIKRQTQPRGFWMLEGSVCTSDPPEGYDYMKHRLPKRR